jgi:hypothetical protein
LLQAENLKNFPSGKKTCLILKLYVSDVDSFSLYLEVSCFMTTLQLVFSSNPLRIQELASPTTLNLLLSEALSTLRPGYSIIINKMFRTHERASQCATACNGKSVCVRRKRWGLWSEPRRLSKLITRFITAEASCAEQTWPSSPSKENRK